MKIGIFTDTYRPSVNGVVYVTEILRRNFEALGHEVYIFAPAATLSSKSDDDHIIRFPAISGVVYEESNLSLFFPPIVLKRIKELDLDVFHFMVPGPVGLMAIYAAHKLNKPVVAEYCTDYFEYVEHYPSAIPGIIALGLTLPFTFKVSPSELLSMLKAGRPRIGLGKWSQGLVKNLLTVIHSHCDAVIAHSRKSAHQLESWQSENDRYPIHIIPTGVDPLPQPNKAELLAFKQQWGIGPQDEVVVSISRLSSEKNLDMLIDMIAELVKERPNAKLMYVGDFDYRRVLEEKAQKSPVADRIIFTGKLPRETLGVVHASAKVLAFPSLTDTQGLVLHEAAQSGLPIVMIDQEVTEVVHNGENGYFCQNDPADMAAKVAAVLADGEKYERMSKASRKIAKEFSEQKQCEEIIEIYERISAKTTSEAAQLSV
ncbi:MAG: glycosyltransferase [Candidatus Saccharimonadales bacterium]